MNLRKVCPALGRAANPTFSALQKGTMLSSFVKAQKNCFKRMPIATSLCIRSVYDVPSFKDTTPAPKIQKLHDDEAAAADHLGRQQNHIWSKEEIDERLQKLYRHQPSSLTDHTMNRLMYTMYHSFNFISGYSHKNPTTKSIEWRLVMLESLAGVPGFLAAGFRHFRSLRTLQRDHGWIATLLEEAENERMHLLVCLKMADASFLTRTLVVALQVVMTPFLMSLYVVHPKSVHRFVGYLEETACHTYASIIDHINTPGTHLHKDWHDIAAPAIAIGYWRLPQDAKWVDALRCMFADEANHRDVNHTLAGINQNDPNPFAGKHMEDAAKAFLLEQKKERCW